LGRSILLARWLPIEIFGIYAGARAFVEITSIIPSLGMSGAFLHRAREVEDEDQAASIHFTLKLIFTFLWIMALFIIFFVQAIAFNQLAFLVITTTTAISHLTETPSLILTRRVVHRRLALIQITIGTIGFITAVAIANISVTQNSEVLALWALLSTHVVIVLSNVFFLYLWNPVWRPKIAWAPEVIRYYLRFGGLNFISTFLLRIIDRIDDLWTNWIFGETALGFYSRAYTFATYPRELIARPVNKVSLGSYATLKGNREGLSKAFFRTNAFLVRSSFYLAGLLSLIAPEFINLVLTDKWMPMLTTFRLMLIFTLIDPLKTTVGNLLVAVGNIKIAIYVRAIQLGVLIAGLILFWKFFDLGIAGVAIAVDIMLVVGIGLMFWKSRAYVDYSPIKMFLPPTLSLSIGLLLGRLAIMAPGVLGSDLRTGLMKSIFFTLPYVLILLLTERQQTKQMFREALNLYRNNGLKQ
jgi:O-antigen/teichoic acid export membrane protein